MVVTIDPKTAQATSKEKEKKLTFLLRVGLAANSFLFVGGFMSMVFYSRELVVEWWTRDVVGDVLYLIGFTAIFLSGALELGIDIGLTRSFGHGRYTTMTGLNIFITVLFLLGNLGDLIAFSFWRKGKEGIQEEHLTQWVSTHIFLLTAVLVLITNRPKFVPFQNQLDSVANVSFLCEALLSCCARYVSTVGDTQKNQTEMRLELASTILWMSSAFVYILADLVRLKDPSHLIHS